MPELKEYVKLWTSYSAYFEPLGDAEVGRLARAMINYKLSGAEPKFNGNERFIWPAIKLRLDHDDDDINNPSAGRHTSEYKAWRKAVFERDNYTCQSCGKIGGKLNAHHIERYRNNVERRTDVSNGITLCEECHRLLHKIEGM